MRAQFEDQDMAAVAAKVVELIKPLLSNSRHKDTQEDQIFTVKTLAEYLGVSVNWVYERSRKREIPRFKVGRLVRFRKSEIDRWMATVKTPAMTTLSSSIPAKKKGE